MPAAAQALADSASAGAAAKQVDLDVQAYQKARNVFINAVKEHLLKDDGGVTIEALIRNDIIALLCCPLTAAEGPYADPVQGTQIEALKNVGRVGKIDRTAAEAISRSGAIDSMVLAQTHRNPRIQLMPLKKGWVRPEIGTSILFSRDTCISITLTPLQEAANEALCSLSESSLESAQTVLETGMLSCIKQQLDGTDAAVKESGLNAVASIVGGSKEMAAIVADGELLDAIVQHLKFPESPATLITSACIALSKVAAHTQELAQRVSDAGPAAPVVALLNNSSIRDTKLQAAALRCLSHVAKHDTALATGIVNAGAVSPALRCAIDELHPAVRHAAAAMLHQIACRTPLLTEVIASQGCVSALVKSLQLDHGTSFALPPLLALGYIASFAPTFANAVRDHGSAPQSLCLGQIRRAALLQVLDSDAAPEFISALASQHSAVHTAASWAIHHMALHGSRIADQLASAGVLPPLIKLYKRAVDGSEARATSKAAIKEVIKHSSHQGPLLVLVDDACPPELMKKALKRGKELMQASVGDRREFVTMGALMTIQRVEPLLDAKGKEFVQGINKLFPVDVVNYYRNGITG